MHMHTYTCIYVCLCANYNKFFLLAYHVNVQKHIDDLFETVLSMITTLLYDHRNTTTMLVMNIISSYDHIQLLTKL